MPTTTGLATSYIQFTRTSNATVTDSDGKIKWAGHNVLTNSESFDAAAWAKDNTGALNPVVTANYGAAPDGTQTADRIVFNKTGGTYSRIMQTVGTPSAVFTFRVWMKTTSGGTSNVGLRINGDGVNCVVTGAWTLFSITATAANTVQEAQILLFDSIVGNDETADILAWGAYLFRADLGGMVLNPARGDAYYPTTPPNLLGNTEDFTGAAWSRNGFLNFGSGSVVNATIAPNGLQTADLLVADTTSTARSAYQVSTVGGLNVQSLYVKPAGYTKVALRESHTGAYFVSFNLESAGAVLTASGATGSITSVGDGWYRISMVGTIVGTTRWSVYLLSPSYTSGSISGSWSGDGTSGIYVWGAQLSDSASLDAYSPVYGAAVTSAAYYAPRLDFNPSTLAPLGLLVEELRANLLTYSQAIGSAPWSAYGTATAGTTTASPDGSSNGQLITVPTAGNGWTNAVAIVSASATYTTSIYVKASIGTQITFFMRYYNSGVPTGSTTTTRTITSGVSAINGFYRLSITEATPASTNQAQLALLAVNNGDAWYLYGAQLEAGSFATSYIPTGVSTATRTADLAGVSIQAFPFNASEGTLVANGTFIAPAQSGVSTMVSLSSGLYAESINIYRQNSQMIINMIDDNNTQAGYTISAPANLTKAAIAYKLNDTNAAVSGTAQTTDTTCTIPTVNTLDIGRMWSNAFIGSGWIRQITYLPRRISNAELATRTA